MFHNVPVKHSLNYRGQEISLEAGLLAKQATGSVIATIGETTILASVVVGKETTMDFFPLQVIYEEKLYASGKIKGSRFEKREGKPSENAVLTGRMIDRSLRSLFDNNIRNEIQVVITVLSMDEVNPPDLIAVLGASVAIKLTGVVDFAGPVSSMRIGLDKVSPEKVFEKSLKLTKEAESFVELREILADFCEIFDANLEENKSKFKELFEVLNKRDSEWLAKFKILYKSTARLSPQEISQKYSQKINYLINPSYLQMKTSDLDLVVSGNGENICMIEAGANIVPEETIGDCLDLASQEIQVLNNFQNEFLEKAKSEGFLKETKTIILPKSEIGKNFWLNNFREEIEQAYYQPGNKMEKDEFVRNFQDQFFADFSLIEQIRATKDFSDLEELKKSIFSSSLQESSPTPNLLEKILDSLSSLEEFDALSPEIKKSLDEAVKKIVKQNILEKEKRLDGRPLNKTRQIICQNGVLARTHGSSLFQRGDTQVLNILTLGSQGDAQILDNMENFEEGEKRYIHHYNFPPYSVGETGRYGYPGRREIGHGALAEKALVPVLPSEEDFPYTMRLVSECLGSNGSTSMASTCASCLSLMDGGVPIKAMVAGVAMGLILDPENQKFKVLTDILGAEDHFGDMDFKVTGTRNGITAIQLDNKIAGLTVDILKQALLEARAGRFHILDVMEATISEPKSDISKYAPRVEKVSVPPDKIGDLIGPSGKTIKGIIAKTGATIDVDDVTGKTLIYGKDSEKVKLAKELVLNTVKVYEVDEIIEGTIFRIENYGAFVKINNSETEGLIHISEIENRRIEKVTDVLEMGQKVKAKIIAINEKGQINLSIKALKA